MDRFAGALESTSAEGLMCVDAVNADEYCRSARNHGDCGYSGGAQVLSRVALYGTARMTTVEHVSMLSLLFYQTIIVDKCR